MMRFARLAGWLLVSGACAVASATDTLGLVADIDQTVTAGSIGHDGFVASQGLVFFTHTTSTTGTEVWRSDGTEAGTFIAADVVVGRQGSSPSELTDWNGRLYFSALVRTFNTWGLWKTDGTEAGTELVAPTPIIGDPPERLTPAGDRFFFTVSGRLYATDGTTDGTVPVTDPNIGFVREPIALGSQVLFVLTPFGGQTAQLWISDGTPDGTVMLKDVPPRDLIPLGSDRIVFWVEDIGLSQLWASDGTATGTVFVQDVQRAPGVVFDAVPFGDRVVFFGFDPVADSEPWITDGTAAGTNMIRDIDLSRTEQRPENLIIVDNYVYFENGGELWRTDGTLLGTTIVATAAGTLDDAIGYNGLLYFAGNELMHSDGTALGTGVAVDLDPSSFASPRGLSVANGWLWFAAFTPATGQEVWRSDGTLAGTQVISAIAGGTLGSEPEYLTGAGDTLFFSADDNISGREPWGSDGTLAGTVLLNDIRAGLSDSSPDRLIDGDGILYFIADVFADDQLWRSDGTLAGTQLVFDSGDFGFGVDRLEYLNGAIWFGTRGSSSSTFWTSDGTPGGTVPVINYSTSSGPDVIDIALAGDTVVFAVDTGFDSEHLLYRTDGTLPGTEQFATFADPPGGLPPMATLGDWLIFTAERAGFGSEGREVWRTDATAVGTEIVADIRPGSFDSSPTEFTTVGDRVFFAATAPDQVPGLDRELWMTDGSNAGTQQVFEINPTGASNPSGLVATADAVVFTAATPEAGRELWLSRGPNDTYQIVDLYPGPDDGDISEQFAVGGTVFFRANDNVSGEELWRSDGTLAGTRIAADVVPGSGGSAPADLAFVNNVLYFTADDGVHGREVWALETNIAPWFTTLPAETAIENIEYSYTAAVTDANPGDTLTLTIVDAPAGVLFDPLTGLLTWTPTTAQVGFNTFSLVLTDQDGESATQTLRIDVLADTDADAIPDVQDNCSVVVNADQRDTDGDGFGNLCDGDLDGSCIVDIGDLMLFRDLMFSNDPDADLDGDGSVNFIDIQLLRQQFFAPPGPSGLASC